MMDPKIKRRWVARLRSGIPQSKGALGRPDGSRCCLGVLCDIAMEAGVIEPPALSDTGDLLRYDGNIGHLPIRVTDWCGLTSVDPRVRGTGLSQWNDSGLPFSDIAKMIEQSAL